MLHCNYMKKNVIKYLTPAIFISLISINFAKAICPVCVVVVAGGVGLTRWLKVDDVITGIWLGAALISLSLWTIIWLKDKKWTFPLYQPVVFLVTYGLVIIPLYLKTIIGHPANTFWGIDKLVLGMAVGTATFILGVLINNLLKKKNNGKVYFPFQKVFIPVVLLLIASVVFYYVLRLSGHQVTFY